MAVKRKKRSSPTQFACIRPGLAYKKVKGRWQAATLGKTVCGDARVEFLKFSWGGMSAAVVRVRGEEYAAQAKGGRVFRPGKNKR